MAIGRAVVHYAHAARAFSAGVKCRHCGLYFLVSKINSDHEWIKYPKFFLLFHITESRTLLPEREFGGKRISTAVII